MLESVVRRWQLFKIDDMAYEECLETEIVTHVQGLTIGRVVITFLNN